MPHTTTIKLYHKGLIFYYIKNQLIIFGIGNNYVSVLFIVIYINKESNHILCYSFTYQHEPCNIISLVK